MYFLRKQTFILMLALLWCAWWSKSSASPKNMHVISGSDWGALYRAGN
jgi:hypothetical protein